jgi:beta-galactosidase GanA
LQALGFNFVRLTLNWNLLEPEPGNYSQVYLDRIAQVR